MRMGMIDQLELFGATCRPMTTLARWTAPTPREVIREGVARQIAQPVRRSLPASCDPVCHEDPERWDGLS